jgi:hypothetical protein
MKNFILYVLAIIFIKNFNLKRIENSQIRECRRINTRFM